MSGKQCLEDNIQNEIFRMESSEWNLQNDNTQNDNTQNNNIQNNDSQMKIFRTEISLVILFREKYQKQ